ncbi:hypothetical protein HN873_054982 [Arachis hypogaea]
MVVRENKGNRYCDGDNDGGHIEGYSRQQWRMVRFSIKLFVEKSSSYIGFRLGLVKLFEEKKVADHTMVAHHTPSSKAHHSSATNDVVLRAVDNEEGRHSSSSSSFC